MYNVLLIIIKRFEWKLFGFGARTSNLSKLFLLVISIRTSTYSKKQKQTRPLEVQTQFSTKFSARAIPSKSSSQWFSCSLVPQIHIKLAVYGWTVRNMVKNIIIDKKHRLSNPFEINCSRRPFEPRTCQKYFLQEAIRTPNCSNLLIIIESIIWAAIGRP